MTALTSGGLPASSKFFNSNSFSRMNRLYAIISHASRSRTPHQIFLSFALRVRQASSTNMTYTLDPPLPPTPTPQDYHRLNFDPSNISSKRIVGLLACQRE